MLVAVGIGLSLLIIYSLDCPFSGVLQIGPEEMEITAQQISRDYAANYTDALPCDDEGRTLTS